MFGNTYLRLKLLKNSFKIFFATTIKSLGKKKTSKNTLIKKFTSALNLIVLNTTNFFSLVGNALMDSYIFFIWYKLIYFSLSLNPAIHRMGVSQI